MFNMERPSPALCSLLLSTIVTLAVAMSTASATDSVTTDTQAMIYLSQYGYLNPSVKNPTMGHLMSEDSVTKAIEDFQSFVGLNVTGNLDNQTLRMMALPRCGVRDKVGVAEGRSRRYALQGSRWKTRDLTYKITKYPNKRHKLSESQVDSEIREAFKVWSEVTDLTFTAKRSGNAHIEIRFETGEHGDGDPFDGPGGTLAHAYFPVYGGDAHFDDSERWTINSYSGTNLKQVAAHEFGHSLGLSHSDVRRALMAPFYRGYEPSVILDSDDITGIQALYGPKTRRTGDSSGSGSKTSTRSTTAPPPDVQDAELCNDPNIDAIFNSAEGSTYVFKGQHYWKLNEKSIEPGYPKLISSNWPGLSGDIDAAFTYRNGKTYFFKGSQYWRYAGRTMDGDYPKLISRGFTGIPNNIDAAFVWGGNGKIYFFKDDKFWQFDPVQTPPVKSTYPKPVSYWKGIPDSVNAALQYTNGYTYFFKGNNYYRFNDRDFAVDRANPSFPRHAGQWWFGCRSATTGSLGNLVALSEQTEVHDRVGSGLLQVDGKAAFPGSKSYRTREEYRDEPGVSGPHNDVDDLMLDAEHPSADDHQTRPDSRDPTNITDDPGSNAASSSLRGTHALAIFVIAIVALLC